MRKTLLPLICFAFSSMMLAQTTTTWKISVQNQGTAGGYILDKEMKSTERNRLFLPLSHGRLPACVVHPDSPKALSR